MSRNRAFIIRCKETLPLLKAVDLGEDSSYWLFESKESFHGEQDEEFFYFKDARIDSRLKLPLKHVILEFGYLTLKEANDRNVYKRAAISPENHLLCYDCGKLFSRWELGYGTKLYGERVQRTDCFRCDSKNIGDIADEVGSEKKV